MAFYPAGGGGSGGGGQQPYQFRPETYGALGNGQFTSDVSSNGTTTYTSPTIAGDATAPGKFVMINGANGTTSGPVIAKILSVNAAANQFVTNVAAGATASGCLTVWGSDDTAAFVACEQAKQTYALTTSKSFAGDTLLGSKIYCLASAGVQTSAGGTLAGQNTQWPVYYPNVNGTTNKYVPRFIGSGTSGQMQYFQSSTVNAAGSVVVSMWNASGGSGLTSVLGGPNTQVNLTGNFANVSPVVKGITFVCPVLGTQNGMDFRFCAGFDIDEVLCTAFASVVAGTSPLLPSLPGNAGLGPAGAAGLLASLGTNNDHCNVGTLGVEGFAFGSSAAEHYNARRVSCIYCNVGLFVSEIVGGVAQHGVSVLYFSCEATNIALQSSGIASDQMPVFIGLMDTEVINTTDIQDTNNTLTGTVYWADFERTTMNVSGAANLKIINTRLAPGTWAGAPAAPASGTAQQNTSFRDATVYASSTVPITAVTVAGVATGYAAAANTIIPIRVPSGESYTITAATGTQTTHWVLD